MPPWNFVLTKEDRGATSGQNKMSRWEDAWVGNPSEELENVRVAYGRKKTEKV